jgi:hypothetical protein
MPYGPEIIGYPTRCIEFEGMPLPVMETQAV